MQKSQPLYMKKSYSSIKILNPFGNIFNFFEKTLSPSNMRNLNLPEIYLIFPIPPKNILTIPEITSTTETKSQLSKKISTPPQ